MGEKKKSISGAKKIKLVQSAGDTSYLCDI